MPDRQFITAARTYCLLAIIVLMTALLPPAISTAEVAPPHDWRKEWSNTDFSKHSAKWHEFSEGGPPRDGILSIDRPSFVPLGQDYPLELAETEPVVTFANNADARAYPLRILTRHEIVNDVVGGLPVAITYCPLCNTAIVFKRVMGERVLDFGTTGKLRHSDLVMYDRQTESWWQQFTGEAIVGEMTGRTLPMLPARLESFANFKIRHPDGLVLLPAYADPERVYRNPYSRYDSRARPYPFFHGKMPKGIAPMARVVAVFGRAWSLQLVRHAGTIEDAGLIITWTPGQNSALDTADIAKGRDVGNVTVQRATPRGLEDVPYEVTFAFAFHAFYPDSRIRTE